MVRHRFREWRPETAARVPSASRISPPPAPVGFVMPPVFATNLLRPAPAAGFPPGSLQALTAELYRRAQEAALATVIARRRCAARFSVN